MEMKYTRILTALVVLQQYFRRTVYRDLAVGTFSTRTRWNLDFNYYHNRCSSLFCRALWQEDRWKARAEIMEPYSSFRMPKVLTVLLGMVVFLALLTPFVSTSYGLDGRYHLYWIQQFTTLNAEESYFPGGSRIVLGDLDRQPFIFILRLRTISLRSFASQAAPLRQQRYFKLSV